MKKAIAFVTSLMMIMALSACGSITSETANIDSEKTADESTPMDSVSDEETEEETLDEEDEDDEEIPSYSKNKDSKNNQIKTGLKENTIEETVLVDQDEIKITATELSYSSYSATLSLDLENNSDKDVEIICGSLGYSSNSVNGVMIEDGYFNCTLNANKKAKEEVVFDFDVLNILGIDEIADIELGIYSSDDDYNHVYYPISKIKTTAADKYDYGKVNPVEGIKNSGVMDVIYSSDSELYNENELKIVSELLVKRGDDTPYLLIEVNNDSDKQAIACIRDIFINGIQVSDSTWSATSINPHKTALLDIKLESVFDKEYWSYYGINEVNSVGFSFYQENMEGDNETEPVEITVPVKSESSEPDTSGDVVYDASGIRIIYKGFGDEEYSMYKYLMLLVENKSGKSMRVDEEYGSLSVNGYMIGSSSIYEYVDDGKYFAWLIEISNNDLEKNNVKTLSDINEIEFDLELQEKENWREKSNATISIKPTH